MTSAAWQDHPGPPAGVRPVAVSSGRRLAPVVYDLLKERLLEGEFQAGERLSVESLKTEFGVSKQPVMDALRRLATAGLAEIIDLVADSDPTARAHGYRLLNRRFHGVIHEMARSPVVAELSHRMWDMS